MTIITHLTDLCFNRPKIVFYISQLLLNCVYQNTGLARHAPISVGGKLAIDFGGSESEAKSTICYFELGLHPFPCNSWSAAKIRGRGEYNSVSCRWFWRFRAARYTESVRYFCGCTGRRYQKLCVRYSQEVVGEFLGYSSNDSRLLRGQHKSKDGHLQMLPYSSYENHMIVPGLWQPRLISGQVPLPISAEID